MCKDYELLVTNDIIIILELVLIDPKPYDELGIFVDILVQVELCRFETIQVLEVGIDIPLASINEVICNAMFMILIL